LYAYLFFDTSATCPANNIFIDFIYCLLTLFPSRSIWDTSVTDRFIEPFSSRPWIPKPRVATQTSVARKFCRIVNYQKNPREFDGLFSALIRRAVLSGLRRRCDSRFWAEERKRLEPLFQNTCLSRDSKKGFCYFFTVFALSVACYRTQILCMQQRKK